MSTKLCTYCNKCFASRQSLNRHLTICRSKTVQSPHEQLLSLLTENATLLSKVQNLEEKVEYIEKEKQTKIQTLEKEKEQLLQQIFEIAKQPKTNHNNNNNQRTLNIVNQLAPYDLDAESVQAMIEEHFDKKCFLEGIEGITKMVAEEILTDRETGKKKMLCTDLARKKVKYVVNGKVVHDIGMQKTLELICPNLAQVNMRHSKREGPPCDEVYLANEEFIRDKSKMCSKIVIRFVEPPNDD
jgi:hypothetical protein